MLALAIDLAELAQREVPVRCDERAALPRRVDRAEEEQLVADDAAAGLDADVDFPAGQRVLTVPLTVWTVL